ncbi:hypothetical protein Tco_1435940, partial [Tanacetum coccineum]
MGVNILKSIDEGPFKMGKFREKLAEGALHLGPERDRVFADLTPKENERFKADIRATNILLQGLPKDIYTLINHYTDSKDIWDNVKMLLEGSELTKDERESQLYDEFEYFCQNKGETITNTIFVTAVKLNKGLKQSNYDQLYAYLKQHEAHANENKMMLERYNQHAIDPLSLVSNILPQQTSSNTRNQATVQNDMVVVQNVQGRQNRGQGNNARGAVAAGNGGQDNALTQSDHRIQNTSKDKMLLMKAQENGVVLDEEQFVGEYHEVHEMQNDIQQNYVLDSYAEYTSDSNIIPYEQYVKNNAEQVVQSNVSSMPNDALMMIINDMHEQTNQCISVNEQNKVVNESLTVELARYKEQVKIYEKRARFELTEREQKIDEQLRIIITNRNIEEESLKKELHSVKIQLNSTIDHNKIMKDEVATLKKDFKQKENKYLEDFLDMKALKEKVKDKLFKQDQSLQTVHMLCKPKPFYDEKKKVAIGYNNPLYLTSAMQVQSALYNGHEIVKTNHAPAVVHDLEDTLEIAKKTRKKILEKMKSPLCVEKRVKIAPLDYSKENYLAIFIPHRHLTQNRYFGPQI